MVQHIMKRTEPPIRLFRSDFLEWFTHVHPVVVPVVWLPVAGLFLLRGIRSPELGGLSLGLAFGTGLVLWSVAEYGIHRFAFHFTPGRPKPWLDRLLFLCHGIHHVQPWDKTRLVMPPALSIPLAALFYGLFHLALGAAGAPALVAPLFSGFLTGYVGYDMLHYATHHLPMNRGPLRWLKRHHMLHHYSTPDSRYGVSTPAWDLVLGTLPARTRRASKSANHGES